MKKDVLRGKKLFGGFVCVQRKSLTLGGKGEDNFMYQEDCARFPRFVTVIWSRQISLFPKFVIVISS